MNKKFSIVLIVALMGILSVNAQQHTIPDKDESDFPVIGILSAPSNAKDDDDSYIHVGYAEFLKDGEAKAVPIPWDLSDDKLEHLLSSVNGLVVTGDEISLYDRRASKFYKYQERLIDIVDYVIERKAEGDHFPLIATGHGLESIVMALTEQDAKILEVFEHTRVFDKIELTDESRSSLIFEEFPRKALNFLEETDALYFDHRTGLSVGFRATYDRFRRDQWIVSAVAKDFFNKTFVAAMESKKYPMYLVMFQPERVIYEVRHNPMSTIPSGAFLAAKQIALSFIKDCKKNDHEFEHPELLNNLLIQNFPIQEYDGTYYVVSKEAVNDLWGVYGLKSIVFKFGLLVLAILGGLYAYNKYRQSKGMPEITYQSFVDGGQELKQKLNNDQGPRESNNKDVFI